MEAIVFQDLTNEETETTWGGASALGCAMLGGLAMACFATGNGLGVAGALIAAYNGGCFD